MSQADGRRPRLRSWVSRLARAAGVQRTSTVERMRAEWQQTRRKHRANVRSLQSTRDRLEETVGKQAAEIERLRTADDVSSARVRPDLSYLFVLTYGRSGSTLLQGILSSTPGVMIRGENGAVLQDLFRFHDTATRHRERLARPDPLPSSHPWWGIDGYRDETAWRDMRLLMLEAVLRPDPDTRVVGFKEIYWMHERVGDYIAFVRNVFPGARFIYNTRDLDDVAQSKWWARNPNARQELQDMEKQYDEVVAGLGADAYRVHFNEYVADPSVLRGLFAWLGEEFDEERVRAVMAVRHSY